MMPEIFSIEKWINMKVHKSFYKWEQKI